MRDHLRSIHLICLICLLPLLAAGAAETDRQRLDAIRSRALAEAESWRGPAYRALLGKVVGPQARLNADPGLELMGVRPDGRPLFYAIENLDAAITVSTDAAWPGGWTGLALDGANQAGELAVWDAGAALATHQEFQGRVAVPEGAIATHYHSTHVAGTMVAAGIDPQARGMSPAARLDSYRWDDDSAEMAAAAATGLRLSNHSYGGVVGWRFGWGEDDENWYWFGDPTVSEVEDPGFGFYSGGAADWDAIAHAAPYYLICKSAGNDRNDYGPEPGGGHLVWQDGGWTWSTTVRDPDGGLDGFDTIGYRGNAKNILTVGAVHDIAGGWSAPADVQASDFTNWGPTDDGRIKPDLVANGVGLYSTHNSAVDAYATYSGTSMSSPSACGSLNLLVQQYEALHGGAPLRASTLKALVLHTASEAGPAPGPDYMHGWGLLNTAEAALLIQDDAAGGRRLLEDTLAEDDTHITRWYHDGGGELAVTLAWTDPAGSPPDWSLDPADPMLVNDLDLRLVREDDGAIFLPWSLDPSTPAAPATTGENHRDNVEQIRVAGAVAGTYRIHVSHTGDLQGNQVFSLVQTGLRRISLTAAGDVTAAPRLHRATPNPFNPRTEIAFAVDRRRAVELTVYDVRGRRVAELVRGTLEAGEHRVAWDGRDAGGLSVAAGVYLVRLRAGDSVDHLRVTLVK